MNEADLVEVRLLNLPVAVQLEAAEHHDALIREFTLISASSAPNSVPQRLLTLMDDLQVRFQEFSEAPRQAYESARADGAASVDVVYLVPPEVSEAVTRLGELLDEADGFCRAGEHLVTLATPPRALAYRRWFISEFVNQVAGGEPTAWVAPDDSVVAQSTWPTTLEDSKATVSVRGELDLSTAPDLRDHFNALHRTGVTTFELDTSEVTFIDSVGLSVILALYRRCREEGGSVTVLAPSRTMLRTLEVSGLVDVLHVA